MTRRLASTLVAGVVLGATGAALPVATASAKGGDARVVRSGSCSGHADWKLKVKGDDGRLEVEGEVDSNHSGQTWHWRIRHNGSLTAHGVRVTAGRSGSFTVDRRLVNLAGTDHIVFRAVRSKTGEACRGVVNF